MGSSRDERGVVYIEFLFVVLPFMALVLGLMQTALLYIGGMAIQRSASTAARAAMVVLDDDPKFYNGEPRNALSPRRREAIEKAASFPLLAVKTSPKGQGHSVEHALRAGKGNALLGPAAGIASGLEVSYPNGISSRRGSHLTVAVSYRFACEVPLARVFMCKNRTQLLRAESTLPNQSADYQHGVW